MKKLTSIILITAFSVASAQKISDYEYIYVPKELDKKINNYKLDQLLIKNLNSKKYKTFQDSQDNWPTDLQLNKCLVAKANIIDDSSFLKNKIKIQFKDCNDKIISESKGASNEKDYDLGYPDALRQAFRPFRFLTLAKQKLSQTPQVQQPLQQILFLTQNQKHIATIL